MVRLVDRDGNTVRMTREEIAESLRKMGNPPNVYHLLPNGGNTLVSPETELWQLVQQFRASTMPHYRFYQLWHKKFRWWLKQRAARKQFDAVNTKGLIWEPTPFVLKMPWLRLKGRKAITMEVV